MNIEKKKKTRTTVRQATTRLIKIVETELEREPPEILVHVVEELLAQLIAKEVALSNLDKEIEMLTEVDAIEDEINSREIYNESIITWKIRANRIITRQNLLEARIERTRSSIVGEGGSESRNNQRCTVKLPRVELSSYNGDILEFNDFWQVFKTAIHENEDLSNVERFTYLKSYLKDEAELAIRGLSLTDANYKIALDILSKRFGRKELIVDAHMCKLLNLTPVRRSNDTAALRPLYSECEIQIRGLQSLGIEPNSYSCLLHPILLKKIPIDLAMEFSRRTNESQETQISELLQFLKAEIECRERTKNLMKRMDGDSNFVKAATFRYHSDENYEKHNRYKNKFLKHVNDRESYFKPKVPSAAALHMNTVNSWAECIFCNTENDNSGMSRHRSEDCHLSVSDRRNKLIKQARCFNCLAIGHRVFRCCRRKLCSCGKRHHEFICDRLIATSSKRNFSRNQPDSNTTTPTNENSSLLAQNSSTSSAVIANCASAENCSNFVFLQTCSGELVNRGKSCLIRILCDLGSTKSFILSKCVKDLGLKVIAREPMKVFSFGETAAKVETRERVKVQLRNPFNHDQTFCLEAPLTDIVTHADVPVPCREIRQICQNRGIQLSEVFFEGFVPKEICLLIGSDYLWDFYTGKVRRFSRNFVAVETRFGYCLSGTQNFYAREAITMHIATEEQLVTEKQVSEQLERFWNLESLGYTDNVVQLSTTDTEMLKEFNREIKFQNSRCEVKLPWNSNDKELSNNFSIAKRRLMNLVSRFKSDKKFYEEYSKIIENQITEGIVEEVENLSQNEVTPEKVYFMPHHGVIREDKSTTKLRIVYDCSAHEKDFASLNECLFPGPNLNPNLLTILLKFRTHRVAFVADIEKAFLMVSVASEDRDCQRFLWLENPFEEIMKLKVLRTTRVTFGVCSSPFLLAATIKHHIEKYQDVFPEAFSMLNEDLYVDDLITGTQRIEEAYLFSRQSKDILEEASMKLRKWKTNSEELKRVWKAAKFDVVSDEKNHQSPLKVLGITWNSEKDEFKLELSTVLRYLEDQSYTKRKVLQITCTIFDPIGFISPFLIRMKILFQKLWEKGLKWDDELPADLQKEWSKWREEIPELEDLVIPRSYFPKSFEVNKELTELHIFCDASEAAYGAIAYLRFTSKEEFYISFIMSKARVAPLKRLTLPRLELMGTVIAARFASYLQQLFGIKKENQFLWTDSTIAINWIKGHANDWKPFVSNRVVEIQSLTDPQNWNHCSGRENPADHLTRGCTAKKLLKDEKWWKGPKWLAKERIYWPKVRLDLLPKGAAIEHEKRVHTEQSVQLLCQTKFSEPLLEIKNYSNLHRIVRVTAWILRFIYNARHKTSRKLKSLSAEELHLAEDYWIRRVQEKAFSEELQALRLNKSISFTSKIYQLNPFLDDKSTLRIGGRLQNANLKFNETHPILLPSHNHFTDLLIIKSHLIVGPAGVAETLTQLRDRFWIPKGRQRVKAIINHCLTCRRFRVKPASQDMAPLPPDRMNEIYPFEVCGVDFAGPLFIKDESGKAYIALFTCAVTRALHLEIVSNLTTEKFLLAFRRFISRRGICRKIYSDNAKTFKRADKDLKKLCELIEDSEVLDFLGRQGIKWRYIVERAAWWGGFWERMVRSTKSCLKKIMLKSSLKFEELETVLTEVEAIINSRPLTYVYSEDKEPEPLTPGHFLIGRRLTSLPSQVSRPLTSTNEVLTKRYKYRATLIRKFWKEWKKHYLLELRSAHESRRVINPTIFRVGDVVFIYDNKQPRLMWRMGLVTEVYPGRDGKVRSCTIRLPNGTFLKRPVQLLYPLELNSET